MTRWAAAGVAVLAVAMRIPGAVRDAFWQDEVSSAKVLVAHSPLSAIRQVARVEATPPLWYAFGWLANAIGISPEWYRGLSVLAGGPLAGAVVFLARRGRPPWAGGAARPPGGVGWEVGGPRPAPRAPAVLGPPSLPLSPGRSRRHE